MIDRRSIRTILSILALGLAAPAAPTLAQAELNDLEMAHVAVVASDIDIAYAHLALALSSDADVRAFAEMMILHHTAVNRQVADLAKRLGVQAQDNDMSRQLLAEAAQVKDRLSRLRGADFDRAYAENELRYHRTVNGVVETAFIPNIETPEVRQAFQAALATFKKHEARAEGLVRSVQDEMPNTK